LLLLNVNKELALTQDVDTPDTTSEYTVPSSNNTVACKGPDAPTTADRVGYDEEPEYDSVTPDTFAGEFETVIPTDLL